MAIISCPTCDARNRVAPIAQGVQRCPRYKSNLPWVVDADTGSFRAETTASVPVVVDLWAAWCGPCRMIAPILDPLAVDYKDQVKVTKLDVDANIKTATRFNVRSIPMLLFFKGGKVVDQIVGAVPRQTIEAKLKQHVA